MQKQLSLYLLPEVEHPAFWEEVGRLYGTTSSYVHFSKVQTTERIKLVDEGRASGYEDAADVEELDHLTRRVLACCIVFLLHSVPPYVAGDFFVDEYGSSPSWIYSESRFIALLGQRSDYKHERQKQLSQIRANR